VIEDAASEELPRAIFRSRLIPAAEADELPCRCCSRRSCDSYVYYHWHASAACCWEIISAVRRSPEKLRR
jgi:hypothetical protein